MKHYSISIRKDDNPKISYYENIDGKISRKAKDNFGKKLAEDIIMKVLNHDTGWDGGIEIKVKAILT
ncbi:MAG: hypothetical protein Q7K21_08125 [Elusimicrobiota bacterium]|nr:hypothetical protein [Elusimicrobiota bacterium]